MDSEYDLLTESLGGYYCKQSQRQYRIEQGTNSSGPLEITPAVHMVDSVLFRCDQGKVFLNMASCDPLYMFGLFCIPWRPELHRIVAKRLDNMSYILLVRDVSKAVFQDSSYGIAGFRARENCLSV